MVRQNVRVGERIYVNKDRSRERECIGPFCKAGQTAAGCVCKKWLEGKTQVCEWSVYVGTYTMSVASATNPVGMYCRCTTTYLPSQQL